MSFFDVSKINPALPVRANLQGADKGLAKDDQGLKASRATSAGIEVATSDGVDIAVSPVDLDRVEQIRDALRDGSYPIVPAKIADAMIAAKLLLSVSK